VLNADGTTDLYFGPEAPQGRAANWRATVRGGGYFVILRLYGPTEANINPSWKPGDMETVLSPSLRSILPVAARKLE
jgi:hypothetical protein